MKQELAPPASSKGMVLVVTLLMMSVLTLLAGGAVLRTAMNLRDGGAARVNQAAYRVAETGTYASVALAAQLQAGFRDYLSTRNPPDVLTMADMGDAVLDFSAGGGSFGKELGDIGSNPSFIASVTTTDQASAVQGFDASRYCFTTFRIETTALVGASAPTSQLQAATSGQSAIAAQVTVGPSLCGN